MKITKRLVGIVNSARMCNCYDFARHLLMESDILVLGRHKLRPCSFCDYQCLRGMKCPRNDDLAAIYEKLQSAEGFMLFSPVYEGRPPSLFSILEERLPAMWGRKEGQHVFKNKEFTIVVVGNNGAGETLDSLHAVLRKMGARIVGTMTVIPKNYKMGTELTGSLIKNASIIHQLEALISRFSG